MPHPQPIPVIALESTDSTSLEARRRLANAPTSAPFWVAAAVQTGGRGRDGRHWHSPRGGLWATLAYPLDAPDPRILPGLGLRLGVALAESLARFLAQTPASVELKWPNDILLDGRKAAGLLTEIIAPAGPRWALVGCGVNVANATHSLPAPVADASASLVQWLDPPPAPADLLADLSPRFASAIAQEGVPTDLLARARQLLHGVGQPATLRRPGAADLPVTLVGLTTDGRALYRDHEGREFPSDQPIAT